MLLRKLGKRFVLIVCLLVACQLLLAEYKEELYVGEGVSQY